MHASAWQRVLATSTPSDLNACHVSLFEPTSEEKQQEFRSVARRKPELSRFGDDCDGGVTPRLFGVAATRTVTEGNWAIDGAQKRQARSLRTRQLEPTD